jgi:hypothetical protein
MGTEVTPSVPHIPPLFNAIILNDITRNELREAPVVHLGEYRVYTKDRARLRKAAEEFIRKAQGA